MSPELFSKQPCSVATDVYSYGLVLYFLYTQKVPFEGLSGAKAATKAAKMHSRPIFPDNIPDNWKELISKCWHKNPHIRPSTPEIIEKLQKMKDDISKSSTSSSSSSENQLNKSRGSISLIDTSLLENQPLDLKREDYESPSNLLLYQFKSMVNDSKYSDFTIKVGNESFAAHRAILAARSENFAAEIDIAGDSREMIIDSKIATPLAIKIILEFLYTGKLPIDSSSVFEVMHAAQSLNLSQAVDICKEFMDDFGVPVTIDESIETTESFIDIKESLLNAEKNIQNVESVLDILNQKLSSVTSRVSK